MRGVDVLLGINAVFLGILQGKPARAAGEPLEGREARRKEHLMGKARQAEDHRDKRSNQAGRKIATQRIRGEWFANSERLAPLRRIHANCKILKKLTLAARGRAIP